MATLNEFKSPGPDELHPRMLKELAEEISEPLAIIFEKSYRTGEVPIDWRRANVVPIFKRGKCIAQRPYTKPKDPIRWGIPGLIVVYVKRTWEFWWAVS